MKVLWPNLFRSTVQRAHRVYLKPKVTDAEYICKIVIYFLDYICWSFAPRSNKNGQITDGMLSLCVCSAGWCWRRIYNIHSDSELIHKCNLKFLLIQKKSTNTDSDFFSLIQIGFWINTKTILKTFWVTTESQTYSKNVLNYFWCWLNVNYRYFFLKIYRSKLVYALLWTFVFILNNSYIYSWLSWIKRVSSIGNSFLTHFLKNFGTVFSKSLI